MKIYLRDLSPGKLYWCKTCITYDLVTENCGHFDFGN